MNVPSFTFLGTLALGAVVVVGAYLVYILLEKLKFKIDEKFFYAIVPGLFLIVFVRVFEDAGYYPNIFLFKSPGIEMLYVAISIATIFFAWFLRKWKNINPNYTIALTLGIPALLHIPFIKIVNPYGALMILGIASLFAGALFVAKKFLKFSMLSFWAMFAHFLDASATFVAMTLFTYSEQHLLPSALINTLGGPWIMFPLKAAVIIPVVWIINNQTKDELPLRNLILISIAILGFAPGLRDLFRLLMGV